MSAHVLIAGHEASAVEALRMHLEVGGYRASSVPADDAVESLLLAHGADLVLLGPRLPLARRLALCKALRNHLRLRSIGIVAVSDGTDAAERIDALSSGADDVVAAPYSILELIARIEAVLRRAAPQRIANVLRYGDIELDRAAHRVTRGSRTIPLKPREFRLLEFFLENPGRVQSRSQLLAAAWEADAPIDDRTVVVHIVNLRRALSRPNEVDPIRTIRGMGYVLGGT